MMDRAPHLGLFALALAVALGAACSPNAARPGRNACTLRPSPPGCGDPCSASEPCSAGTHCASGRCAAECSDVAPCGTGEACSSDGTCVATTNMDAGPGHDAFFVPIDAPRGDTTCASVEVTTTMTTPNVILIIDQSGSMGMEQFPAGSGVYRWDALEGALMANPDGLIFSLQGSVRWGMAFYREPAFSCPAVVSVPCGLNNYAALNSTYTSLSPGGGTPTGESINQVIATRDGLIDDPNQPTIFILATDGEPYTCGNPDDIVAGQAYSVGAVRNAFDLGIRTYVISVGSDIDMGHLQDVANAGVGSTGTPAAPFWLASDTASLSSALATIVGGAVSCNLLLNGTLDPSQACSGTVTLAGTELVCNDPNGWHAVDPTHIQLDGTACDMLLSGVTPLHATFPCGVILI